MTTTAPSRADVECRPRLLRAFRCWRAGLVLCWVVTLLTAYVIGEHRATLGELYDGVASGDVHSVSIEGGLAPGAQGSTTQFVRWRDGYVVRIAEVLVSRPAATGTPSGYAKNVERTTDDVAAEVAKRSGEITVVVPEPDATGRSASARGSVLGWGVPEGLSSAVLVLLLLTLVYLALSPEPWRASRWAWFWLISSPVGALVFLFASGPVLGVRRTHPTSRRLKAGADCFSVSSCMPLCPSGPTVDHRTDAAWRLTESSPRRAVR